jgi:hypothetical protein
VLGFAAGCGDPESNPTLPAGGSGTTSTTSAGGSGGSGGTGPLPPSEPVLLPVTEWVVAEVKVASSDKVFPAIDDGSFALPKPGDSYLDVTWESVAPGENGALVEANADLIYAAAHVTVPDGHHVFARGDTVAGFYLNGASRHPGDFYHSRAIRVPLGVDPGENLVIVRALGRRAIPEVELWTTTSEIVIQTADVTAPDLVVGSQAPAWLGVPVLQLTTSAVLDLTAEVLESDHFTATKTVFPAMSPRALTQVAFALEPKAPWATAGETIPVALRVSSPDLAWTYEAELGLTTVDAGARYRETRRSAVDGSVQYHAVLPPSGPEPTEGYGLILSLHGAGVEAGGQAAAYSPKPWAYLVAPTNRRPFGFDWEEWGRLDAVEALDHTLASKAIDETRVHLTGHSMGGHGTWHSGVHFGQRFAVVAPSAGWISFETYGGPAHPAGPVGRARAASKTLDFAQNLAQNSVYIIHGAKDDNVPVGQAQTMFDTLGPMVPDLTFYKDPNGRHWWDNDPNEEGADCVDYEPMIAMMEARTLDPIPLDFTARTPSPWIRPRQSFVTLRSAASPMEDITVTSAAAGDTVTLTTTNLRSLVLDGDALAQKGIATVVVDGASLPVTAGLMPVGPQEGKRADLQGPMNQVFHRPFCIVYDESSPLFARYAAYLSQWWSVLGNGQACTLPRASMPSDLGGSYNIVHVGWPRADLPFADTLPVDWTPESITLGGKTFTGVAAGFVYPAGDRLAAAIVATAGSERLIFRYMPFTSRAGQPDWFVFGAEGGVANGFFDAEWKLDPAFATGL